MVGNPEVIQMGRERISATETLTKGLALERAPRKIPVDPSLPVIQKPKAM
jgi:hypothetical protein